MFGSPIPNTTTPPPRYGQLRNACCCGRGDDSCAASVTATKEGPAMSKITGTDALIFLAAIGLCLVVLLYFVL